MYPFSPKLPSQPGFIMTIRYSLHFYLHFRLSLSISTKKKKSIDGILLEIALNLEISVGRIDSLKFKLMNII